jgi:hypothetical protein
MAAIFPVGGFVLVTAGIAAKSIPLACIFAGAVLFVSGGLEQQRK